MVGQPIAAGASCLAGCRAITRHYELALRPNNEGTNFKNSVNLMGDELKLSGVVPSTGVKVDYVYRRAK
jgi:hypothetical protein